MNEILSQINPLTRGIIWITQDKIDAKNPYYQDIDYLLDGLLTSSLRSNDEANKVLVGKNFGSIFYVFIGNESHGKELKSFFDMFQSSLKPENDICVIDEKNGLAGLQKIIPDDIKKRLRVISK